METDGKIILVIGATGNQGRAATAHLQQDGWKLRALAHHADAPEWRVLRETGVELVPGDLMDRASLDRAVEGCYGVFSMQTPREVGYEGEEIEGKNIADAASEAGVSHFVYNSVQGAEAEHTPGWVAPKHHIEEHLEALDMPTTIWRPVTFMENFLRHRDEILGGRLVSPLWPESMAYYIAVDDIGRFVALAFRDPQRFIGTRMAIAGDAMTMEDVAETFSQVLGIRVQLEHGTGYTTSPPRPKAGEPQHVRADIAECRRLLPEMATLGHWVEMTGWKSLVAH